MKEFGGARTLLGGVATVAIFGLLAGCGSYSGDRGSQSDGSAINSAPTQTVSRQTGTARAVVRQASLTVEVADLDKSEAAMKQSIEASGGYIDKEEGTNLAGDEPVLRVTARVPESRFEGIIGAFEKLGRRTEKSIWATDVTEQILDAQANLEMLQHRTSLAGGGDAKRLADQIRSVEQHKEELSSQATMSTVDLTMQQKANLSMMAASHAGWGGDTWDAAVGSATNVFRVLASGAIYVLVFSPLWGSVLIACYVLARSRRRRAGKRQAVTHNPAPADGVSA